MRRAAVSALCVVLAGCGSGEEGDAGRLEWDGTPRVLTPPTLPNDRILSGRVRNESLRRVTLEAAELKLLDAEGRDLDASPIFLEGYVEPLESRNRPSLETTGERIRRGLEARIDPGKTAPLTVSWRDEAGRRAARLDYGTGSLALP